MRNWLLLTLPALMLYVAWVRPVTATPLPIQQDTVQAGDTGVSEPAPDPTDNPDLFGGLFELMRLGAAFVGAWLFKKWNVAQGKLDGINNGLKAALGTIAVTAMGIVGTYLHVAVSSNTMDWGAAFWQNIATGLFATGAVWLGIKSSKEKTAAPVRG